MIKIDWKKLACFFVMMLPVSCFADVPSWKIVPADSSLTFTATQNGAPVTGQFKSFTGDIYFDPNQLAADKVKITIDMASVSDAYNQLSDTLKTPDWFNIKIFPQAVFQSTDFVKTGDKTFECKGTLTIRDKTLPVTLMLTEELYSPTKAIFKGTTIIKRIAFGVGQGQWADTSAVKDDVQINFTVTAIPK